MRLQTTDTATGAQALGVTLQSVEVQALEEFDNAFSAMTAERPDALIVFVDGLTLAHRKRIADFAAKSRLPMIAELKEFAEADSLKTYGTSRLDLRWRAATCVDKILKGAKPADLPVE